MTCKNKISRQEMTGMSKQTKDAISIIPLLLGSLLMLAAGFRFISSKHIFFAGLVCFIVFAFIEGISRKRINVKREQGWKSHQNIEHK
jgi:hypothetical protein